MSIGLFYVRFSLIDIEADVLVIEVSDVLAPKYDSRLHDAWNMGATLTFSHPEIIFFHSICKNINELPKLTTGH